MLPKLIMRNLARGMIAAMLLLPASVQAEELPHLNFQDFISENAARIAIEQAYPKGSDVADVMAALELSVPEFTCNQFSEELYVCGGKYYLNGGYIIEKHWTLDILAPNKKLELVTVTTSNQAYKDQHELEVDLMTR